MNCATQMLKAFKELVADAGEFYDVQTECQDDWSADYAIIIFYLIEEEYRDYEAIEEDIIERVAKSIGDVQVVRGKQPKPKKGYVLQVHSMHFGLSFELELYSLKKTTKKKQ